MSSARAAAVKAMLPASNQLTGQWGLLTLGMFRLVNRSTEINESLAGRKASCVQAGSLDGRDANAFFAFDGLAPDFVGPES